MSPDAAGGRRVVWVIEALELRRRRPALLKLLPTKLPVILAINKIDRVKDKKLLLPSSQADERAARNSPRWCRFPRSATREVEALVLEMVPLLPEGPAHVRGGRDDHATERFLAAELVREKLFRLLGDELPYATAVEIEQFETSETLRRIHVGDPRRQGNQKAIIIGKGGEKLKAISTQARKDMERLFGGKVFLETWVRVRSGWADDEAR